MVTYETDFVAEKDFIGDVGCIQVIRPVPYVRHQTVKYR